MDGGPAATPGVTLRHATEVDLAACVEIQRAALEDYLTPLSQVLAWNAPAVHGLYAHLLTTDPDRFVVADSGGTPIGFASAWVRGGLWYLAFLFVLPAEQGRGIGKTLLEAVVPGPAERAPDGEQFIRAVATDSLQPISNALYARYGMVPRVPAFTLRGAVTRPDAFPPFPPNAIVIPFAPDGAGAPTPGGDGAGGADASASGVTAGDGAAATESGAAPSDTAAPAGHAALPSRAPSGRPGAWDDPSLVLPPDARQVVDVMALVDREVLGFVREADHRWLARDRRGVAVADADGRPLGYGYLRGDGRIGPIAAVDPSLAAAIVGHLVRSMPPAIAEAYLIVPGTAGDTFSACLEAGLRIAEPPTIVGWDRPFADLSRYVPIGLALI